ncbi:MAG: hypothetical protein QOK48_905 [Blastocatellia bacterium]|jgi:hypothetical protein|nr:hypothetical protein [Blastocatellia bacterium]MDX6499772.1 hypothetical protein [Blastocatellia bacterium]
MKEATITNAFGRVVTDFPIYFQPALPSAQLVDFGQSPYATAWIQVVVKLPVFGRDRHDDAYGHQKADHNNGPGAA